MPNTSGERRRVIIKLPSNRIASANTWHTSTQLPARSTRAFSEAECCDSGSHIFFVSLAMVVGHIAKWEREPVVEPPLYQQCQPQRIVARKRSPQVFVQLRFNFRKEASSQRKLTSDIKWPKGCNVNDSK
jgi:hypothetical protein